MIDRAIARKYAHALFSAALAKNEVRACQQGLEEIIRIAGVRPRLAQVLRHPFIGIEEKRVMIRAAMGEFATPLLERFLTMLVRRARLEHLEAIGLEFQEWVDRHQGVEPLRVRTAFALSEAKKKQLQAQLEKWRGTRVRLDIQEDPSLIGGLVIQTRDHVLDQSLKGQLDKLQKQLSA